MGWIIFAAVVAVIVLLLLCPAKAKMSYGENSMLKVTFLCFTIFGIPKKERKRRPKKAKKPKKKAKAEKASADNDEEKGGDKSAGDTPEKSAKKDKKSKKSKGDKLTFDELLSLIKLVTESLGKPLKKLLKRIRVTRLDVRIVCGGEDAAAAAMNFGRTNIVIGNTLAIIDGLFTLKSHSIDITADFQSEETLSDACCVLKMPLYAAFAFLFTVVGRAGRFYFKNKQVQPAVAKLAR